MSSKSELKIVSWNVNGIRAVEKKGFHDAVKNFAADIFCLQETKAQKDQLGDSLLNLADYKQVDFNSAERKGYSGVANYFSKDSGLVDLRHGIEDEAFNKKYDVEGRVIKSKHKLGDLEFTLFNIYFPNGGASDERLKFKLEFYDDFLDYIEELKKSEKNIIITGDFNTAHHEIDLARPKDNLKTSGFMPIERERLDSLEELGFFDAYRSFYPELAEKYTWWSFRTAARKRNVGWRIDYFYMTDTLRPFLKAAEQHDDVLGSDHCPVSIVIAV